MAGTVTEADVLDANAERMTAEIRLLREKAGDPRKWNRS